MHSFEHASEASTQPVIIHASGNAPEVLAGDGGVERHTWDYFLPLETNPAESSGSPFASVMSE